MQTSFYMRKASGISWTNQMYIPTGRELQEWMSKTNIQEFSSNRLIFSLFKKKKKKKERNSDEVMENRLALEPCSWGQ